MTERAHVELDAQYRQLREECGLLDRSERGKLLVSGPDAAEYLQGQLTNDVEALEPGDGQYAALLDRKGHMQADMRVLRPAGRGDLDRHRAGGAAGGPAPPRDVLDRPRRRGRRRQRGAGDPLADRAAQRRGRRHRAAAGERLRGGARRPGSSAWPPAPPAGIDLIAAAADAERLREALLAAGAVEVAPEAVEILRIESGTPRFGAEMGTETMPAEAGIVEAAVSFTKGCYIGQETGRPPPLQGPPQPPPARAAAERPGGGRARRCGWARRRSARLGGAAVSPALGPIGLAIVRREAEPGTELAVGEDGVTARVVDLPFG